MMTFRNAFNLAIVCALGLALSGCSYNRFTGQEEQVKTALAEVQNQLQRRNDLIPNLVEDRRRLRQPGARHLHRHRRVAFADDERQDPGRTD